MHVFNRSGHLSCHQILITVSDLTFSLGFLCYGPTLLTWSYSPFRYLLFYWLHTRVYHSVLQSVTMQCWLSTKPVFVILTVGLITPHLIIKAARSPITIWPIGSSAKPQPLSMHKIIHEEHLGLPGAAEKGYFEKQESRAVSALNLGPKLI